MTIVKNYLSLIKFSHTIFAMPFALIGFFLRLGLIALTMFLVVQVVTGLDRLAFGVAAVVSYIVLLTLEAIAVAKGRERNLDWIS